jgi:hypothetical protein
MPYRAAAGNRVKRSGDVRGRHAAQSARDGAARRRRASPFAQHDGVRTDVPHGGPRCDLAGWAAPSTRMSRREATPASTGHAHPPSHADGSGGVIAAATRAPRETGGDPHARRSAVRPSSGTARTWRRRCRAGRSSRSRRRRRPERSATAPRAAPAKETRDGATQPGRGRPPRGQSNAGPMSGRVSPPDTSGAKSEAASNAAAAKAEAAQPPTPIAGGKSARKPRGRGRARARRVRPPKPPSAPPMPRLAAAETAPPEPLAVQPPRRLQTVNAGGRESGGPGDRGRHRRGGRAAAAAAATCPVSWVRGSGRAALCRAVMPVRRPGAPRPDQRRSDAALGCGLPGGRAPEPTITATTSYETRRSDAKARGYLMSRSGLSAMGRWQATGVPRFS